MVLSPIYLCSGCYLSELPKPEDVKQKIEHSEKDIVYRAVALLSVGVKGYGLDDQLSDIINKYPLEQYFTEDERLYIFDETYNHEYPVAPLFYEYKWRTESACMLFWAIGYFDELKLDNPAVPCEILSALKTLENSDDSFENSTMRSLSEIINMINLYKGYELSTRSVRVAGDEGCADLSLVHPAIVYWRYLALKWLLGMDD